jgi:hypothetical protein
MKSKLLFLAFLSLLACHSVPQESAPDRPDASLSKTTFGPGPAGPFVIPASWKQDAWCVDPQNTVPGGCASDSNHTCSVCNCSTAGDGPCVTFGSILSRWGTNAPTLNQTTNISLMSGEPNTYTDVVNWAPSCGTNTSGSLLGNLVITGTPTVITSGAISSGTNQSTAGNTLGHANLATLAPDSSSLSVGYYALDTTVSPNIGMWLEANTSSTVWNLTAPVRIFSAFPLNQGAPLWGNEPPVQTVGATDNFTIETFPLMNLGSMIPTSVQLRDSACVAIENVTISSGSNLTIGNNILIGQGAVISDSAIHGQISTVGGSRIPATNSGIGRGFSYTSILYNDDIWSIDNSGPVTDQTGHASGLDRTGGSLLIQAGAMAIDPTSGAPGSGAYFGYNLGNVDIQQDFVIGPNANRGWITVGRCRASSIANFTSSTQRVIFTSNFALASDLAGSELGFLWGTGSWNIQDNLSMSYTQSAASVFLTSGTFTIDGQSTMCSISDGGLLVPWPIFCGIPFSAANLAASAGDAGFGNSAFIPGGVRIWQASE